MRDGLSLLMRRLSRMRSSSEEEQQEIILKSLREAVWPVLSRWERILDMAGFLLLLPSVQILVCASDGPFGPNTLRNSNDK
jgi:hypothetical protein